jgi:hypothetical protein
MAYDPEIPSDMYFTYRKSAVSEIKIISAAKKFLAPKNF